ncbi:MAG: PspC domain-containing protein [Bacteroidales bacterium]
MRPTIKINISGVIFHIDEDAYARLREYLTEINTHFAGQAEGKEIIDDIETRIAELLQSGINEQKQVISLDDILEVIRIMGEPEDIFEATEPESETGPETRVYAGPHRLYRDPDNSVLGGVCGGLGAYFGIDPVWLRLAFLLLLILHGFGLLIYIILWIVIPKARTTAQKLEMRGEAVTVTTIERTVRKEYDRVKEGVKNIPRSRAYRQTTNGVNQFMHGLGQVIVALFKAFLILIGFSFLVVGVVTLVALVALMFHQFSWFPVQNWDFPSFSLNHFLGIFFDPVNLPVIQACLALTVGIPLVALIYGGIKLMFRIRTRDRVLGLTTFILWLISTITLVSLGAVEARHFRTDNRIVRNVVLDVQPGDTLFLHMRSRADMGIADNEIWIFDDDDDVAFVVDDRALFIRPELDILPSVNGKTVIEFIQEARGYTREQAADHADMIQYHWTLKGKWLVMDPYFTPGAGEKFRAQELDIRLMVPEGTVLYMEEGLDDMLDYYVDNDRGMRRWEMPGKYWIMGKEELILSE